MLTAYIIILCVSAALAAASGLRMARRIEVMTGSPTLPAGLFASLSALGFLVIVAMPSVVIIGGLLLVAGAWVSQQRAMPVIAKIGVPLIAVLLGMTSLSVAPAYGMPTAALVGLFALGWLALTFTSDWLPDTLPVGLPVFTLILLPLATAPFYTAAPSYLTLDCALLLAPLIGIFLGVRKQRNLTSLCRAPYGFMIGWLMLNCISHHAMLPAAISLVVFLLALAFHFIRTPTELTNAPAH